MQEYQCSIFIKGKDSRISVFGNVHIGMNFISCDTARTTPVNRTQPQKFACFDSKFLVKPLASLILWVTTTPTFLEL